MGLRARLAKHAPIRHPTKRRRLHTVLQELIYLAARVVRSARQPTLRFSHQCLVLRRSASFTPNSPES